MAIGRRKRARYFELRIGDREFSYARKSEMIAAEAALDGLTVIRTSLAAGDLPALEVVRAHRRLSQVEQAFGNYHAPDSDMRPFVEWSAERLQAEALLCMLAYHVERQMRAKLAPLLSGEQDPSPVEAQPRSRASRGKAKGQPTHSLQSLLENLATITCNRIEPRSEGVPPFEMLTRPTEVQRQAFELLGVKLERTH